AGLHRGNIGLGRAWRNACHRQTGVEDSHLRCGRRISGVLCTCWLPRALLLLTLTTIATTTAVAPPTGFAFGWSPTRALLASTALEQRRLGVNTWLLRRTRLARRTFTLLLAFALLAWLPLLARLT